MKYEEIKTDGYLSNFVKCFWTSETTTQTVEHTILPDGYFDLLIELRNGKISTIKLTGIWTIPINVKTELATKIFAVRFKPLATEIFESINLKTILNAATILPNTFLDLNKIRFDSFKSFCLQITQRLETQIERTKPVCSRKIALFEYVFQKTSFNVGELSTKSCLTSRQINRFFNLNYGLSFKTYINIIRCNATFKHIARKDLYPQNEYFDQAHFIKEIKKYTGVTPKELSRNENDRFLQLLTLKAF